MGRPARAALAETEINGGLSQARRGIWPMSRGGVRSSATAEDLPTASFAGQHESFLNVAVCGLSSRRAAVLRIDLHRSRDLVPGRQMASITSMVALSVGVMKMVRSDKAASGVIFTLDTESRDFATWCSSPAPTASARTSSRAR